MKLFVAGATGAVGRPLIRQLVAAGHDVTAMTRSAERAAALRESGAEPVVCDVFEAAALRDAMTAAAPDVVVHQLTALPHRIDLRDPRVFDATNRVRIEGTRLFLDAARAAGARRVVAQSIAFAYAPGGDPIKDEDAPLFTSASLPLRGAVEAVAELERAVTGTAGLDGLVLRFGWLYGPGTYYAPGGSTAGEVRHQRFPIIGEGAGVFSFIQAEDAASATVAAAERGAPGIYNVVDDEPAAVRDWLPVYADVLGAGPPPQVSVDEALERAGPQVVEFSTSLSGASNARVKRELGWQPSYPTWRTGFSTCA